MQTSFIRLLMSRGEKTLGAQTTGGSTYLHICGFQINGLHGSVGQPADKNAIPDKRYGVLCLFKFFYKAFDFFKRD